MKTGILIAAFVLDIWVLLTFSPFYPLLVLIAWLAFVAIGILFGKSTNLGKRVVNSLNKYYNDL